MVSPLTPSTSTGPLMRRHGYFIHEADLTIRVENDIFKIHRYFLTRESAHFRLLLSAPTLPGQEPPGSSESNPLVLNDVTSDVFASFLWIFYNPKYSLYEATSDEWCSILELARKWGFRDVEQLCIRELENLDLSPVERIPIYQRFNLSETRLLDCYESLTARDEPIGVEEGFKLGIRTSVQIACAREVARGSEMGGGLSPSPVQLRGPGLRSLVSEIFQSPPSPTNRTASLNTPLSGLNGVSGLFTPAPTLNTQTPTVRGVPTGGRTTPRLAIQTSSPASTSHRDGLVWQSPVMWSAMATRSDHPLARSTGIRGTSSPITTLPPQPQSPRAPVGRVWSWGLELPSGPEPKERETSPAEGNAATRLERVGTQVIKGSVQDTPPERTPSHTTKQAKPDASVTAPGSRSPLPPYTTPTPLFHNTHIPMQFKRQSSPTLGQLSDVMVPSFQPPKPIIVPTPAFTTPDPTAHTSLPIQFKRQSVSVTPPSDELILIDFSPSRESQDGAPIAGTSSSHQERAVAEVKEKEQADNKARVADAEEEKAGDVARVKAAEIETNKAATPTHIKRAKSNSESKSKAKTQSEPKAKADTKSKAKAKADTKSKTKADKEPKAKANTESKGKGPKVKVDIESMAKTETGAKSSDAEAADARTNRDAEAKAKKADTKAKAEDDAEAVLQKAKGDTELQKTKRDAEVKVKAEVETKVKPDAKAEKEQRAADADIKAKTSAEAKDKAKTKTEAEANTSQAKRAELVKAPGNKGDSNAVTSRTASGEGPSSWVVLDGLGPSTTTATEKTANYLTDSDSDGWDPEDSDWQEEEQEKEQK